MFLKNCDFEILEKIYQLLPSGESFSKLPQDEQDAIIAYGVLLVNLLKKKKQRNHKIAQYIAEKRKIDKNYGRSKKKGGNNG